MKYVHGSQKSNNVMYRIKEKRMYGCLGEKHEIYASSITYM